MSEPLAAEPLLTPVRHLDDPSGLLVVIDPHRFRYRVRIAHEVTILLHLSHLSRVFVELVFCSFETQPLPFWQPRCFFQTTRQNSTAQPAFCQELIRFLVLRSLSEAASVEASPHSSLPQGL